MVHIGSDSLMPSRMTAVDEAVIELLERQLQMPRRVRPRLVVQPDAPIHVHPLEVQRIDRILLALKPVAGNVREDDLRRSRSSR